MIVLEKGYVIIPSVRVRLKNYIVKCCHTLGFDLKTLHNTKDLRISIAKEIKNCLIPNRDFIDDMARLRRYSTSNMYLTIEIIGEPDLLMQDVESNHIFILLQESKPGDFLNVYVTTRLT